jgi:hypothetical protein
MSEPDKPPVDKTTLASLLGQISAVRYTLEVVIATLPDDQQSRACEALKVQAVAADQVNAEFSAFTLEEEAAHQMQMTLRSMLDRVNELRSMLRHL